MFFFLKWTWTSQVRIVQSMIKISSGKVVHIDGLVLKFIMHITNVDLPWLQRVQHRNSQHIKSKKNKKQNKTWEFEYHKLHHAVPDENKFKKSGSNWPTGCEVNHTYHELYFNLPAALTILIYVRTETIIWTCSKTWNKTEYDLFYKMLWSQL